MFFQTVKLSACISASPFRATEGSMMAELIKDPLSVDELIGNPGLDKYEKHFLKELSGGQQQRVFSEELSRDRKDLLKR